jgi:hypothetical protein
VQNTSTAGTSSRESGRAIILDKYIAVGWITAARISAISTGRSELQC